MLGKRCAVTSRDTKMAAPTFDRCRRKSNIVASARSTQALKMVQSRYEYNVGELIHECIAYPSTAP